MFLQIRNAIGELKSNLVNDTTQTAATATQTVNAAKNSLIAAHPNWAAFISLLIADVLKFVLHMIENRVQPTE